MTKEEFRGQVRALRALAKRQRQDAVAARNQLGALRAQLAIMAAEGLLDDELDWVEAVMQVDQIVADLQQTEAG